MSDLETRVAYRKLDLIAQIIEHKKNSSRHGAAEEVGRLSTLLSDLAAIVKEDVIGGWAKVGPKGKLRLDSWLAR
jgi:hypothetical protein